MYKNNNSSDVLVINEDGEGSFGDIEHTPKRLNTFKQILKRRPTFRKFAKTKNNSNNLIAMELALPPQLSAVQPQYIQVSNAQKVNGFQGQGLSPQQVQYQGHSQGLSPHQVQDRRHSQGLSPQQDQYQRHSQGLSPQQVQYQRHSQELSPNQVQYQRHSQQLSPNQVQYQRHSQQLSPNQVQYQRHSQQLSPNQVQYQRHSQQQFQTLSQQQFQTLPQQQNQDLKTTLQQNPVENNKRLSRFDVETDVNPTSSSKSNSYMPPPNNVSLINNTTSNITSSNLSIPSRFTMKRRNFDKTEQNDYDSFALTKKLEEKFYSVHNYNWEEIAEFNLFGDSLMNVFQTRSETDLQKVLVQWLLEGGDRFGLEYFQIDSNFASNLYKNSTKELDKINMFFKNFSPLVNTLDRFKNVLSDYKQHESSHADLLHMDNNYKVLEAVANKNQFPIPLSQVLYATWWIQFGSNIAESQENIQNIQKYLFRSARNSLVIYKLQKENYFDEIINYLNGIKNKDPLGKIPLNDGPNPAQLDTENISSVTNTDLYQFVIDFVKKDNITTLGLSFFNLGNYYQQRTYFNKSVNFFEIGSHLTGDLDCCSMAITGLENNNGLGNVKRLFNKRKETNFYRKKRIAHIYRVMRDQKADIGVGASWAFKDKYD